MDYFESVSEGRTLIPTEEEWSQYERSIATAKQDKSTKRKKNPKRVRLQFGELSVVLQTLNEAYDDEEWANVYTLAEDCLQAGVDWLPELKARFAFAAAMIGAPAAEQAALESIKDTPLEADAYFAIAQKKRAYMQPNMALRWFQLGQKVLHPKKSCFVRLLSDIEGIIRVEKPIYDQVFALICDDSLRKKLKDNKSSAMGDVQEELERLARSTVKDFITVCETSTAMRQFVSVAYSMGYKIADLADRAPTDIEHLRPGAGSWGRLSQGVVIKIMRYCTQMSIVSMHRTCPLLAAWIDHDEVWLNSYKRLIGPTLNVLKTSHISPRLNVVNMAMVFDMIHAISTAVSAVPDGEMTDSNPDFPVTAMEACRDVLRHYRVLMGTEYHVPHTNILPVILDHITIDSTSHTADYYWESRSIIITLALMLQPCMGDSLEISTQVIRLIWAFALKVGPSSQPMLQRAGVLTSMRAFFGSDAHLDACATVAAVHATPYLEQFRPALILPSDLRSLSNNGHERFDLFPRFTGLWHIYFVYQHVDMHGYHEKGVLRLNFDPTTQKLDGDGKDTLGGRFLFRMPEEDQILLGSDRGPLRSTLRYADGTRVRMLGVSHPLGFGGSFVIEKPLDTDHSGPSIVELGEQDETDEASFIPKEDENMSNEEWAMLMNREMAGFWVMIKEHGPTDVYPSPGYYQVKEENQKREEERRKASEEKKKKLEESSAPSATVPADDTTSNPAESNKIVDSSAHTDDIKTTTSTTETSEIDSTSIEPTPTAEESLEASPEVDATIVEKQSENAQKEPGKKDEEVSDAKSVLQESPAAGATAATVDTSTGGSDGKQGEKAETEETESYEQKSAKDAVRGRALNDEIAKVSNARMKACMERIEELRQERLEWPIQDASVLVLSAGSEEEQAIQMLRNVTTFKLQLQHWQVGLSLIEDLENSFPVPDESELSLLIEKVGLRQGPGETDSKFRRRRKLHAWTISVLHELRGGIIITYADQIETDSAILKDENHQLRESVFALWVHRLSITCMEAISTPEDLEVALTSVLQGHLQRLAEEEQGQNDPNASSSNDANHDLFASSVRRRKRGENSGVSTTTLVVLGAIGAAVVVAGAFIAGRFFGNRGPSN